MFSEVNPFQDCIRKVFEFLGPEDLIAMGQVCSQWRRMALEEYYWKPLITCGHNAKEDRLFFDSDVHQSYKDRWDEDQDLRHTWDDFLFRSGVSRRQLYLDAKHISNNELKLLERMNQRKRLALLRWSGHTFFFGFLLFFIAFSLLLLGLYWSQSFPQTKASFLGWSVTMFTLSALCTLTHILIFRKNTNIIGIIASLEGWLYIGALLAIIGESMWGPFVKDASPKWSLLMIPFYVSEVVCTLSLSLLLWRQSKEESRANKLFDGLAFFSVNIPYAFALVAIISIIQLTLSTTVGLVCAQRDNLINIPLWCLFIPIWVLVILLCTIQPCVDLLAKMFFNVKNEDSKGLFFVANCLLFSAIPFIIIISVRSVSDFPYWLAFLPIFLWVTLIALCCGGCVTPVLLLFHWLGRGRADVGDFRVFCNPNAVLLDGESMSESLSMSTHGHICINMQVINELLQKGWDLPDVTIPRPEITEENSEATV